MSNLKVNTTDGGWFAPVLFLVFLVLKLTSVIDWSWWWITLPLWGPPSVVAVVAIILLLTIPAPARQRTRLVRSRSVTR